MEAKELRVQHYLDIMGELGHKPTEGASVLDFGCGNGTLLRCIDPRGIKHSVVIWLSNKAAMSRTWKNKTLFV